MTPREAVAAAKRYLHEVFADEPISNLGLEEIEYDEHMDVWSITLGFSRPWHHLQKGLLENANPFGPPVEPNSRDYRLVQIRDEDGKVKSLKIRELAA